MKCTCVSLYWIDKCFLDSNIKKYKKAICGSRLNKLYSIFPDIAEKFVRTLLLDIIECPRKCIKENANNTHQEIIRKDEIDEILGNASVSEIHKRNDFPYLIMSMDPPSPVCYDNKGKMYLICSESRSGKHKIAIYYIAESLTAKVFNVLMRETEIIVSKKT